MEVNERHCIVVADFKPIFFLDIGLSLEIQLQIYRK